MNRVRASGGIGVGVGVVLCLVMLCCIVLCCCVLLCVFAMALDLCCAVRFVVLSCRVL